MRFKDQSIFVKARGVRPRLYLVWALAAMVGAGVVSGCASPYVDSRREAGKKVPVGPSTADVVALCYSPLKSTKAEVKVLADSECAKTGRIATFDRENRWNCTLTDPVRAFYRCTAKP
jgi:hypothetical protein